MVEITAVAAGLGVMSDDASRRENILKIGVCSLAEIEERIKAYRVMNQHAKKRRFVVAREPIADSYGAVVVDKAEEIDLPKIMLLRRSFKGDHQFKIFAPDDGIVIVSDMSTPEGVKLSMDTVTQIMNLGAGSYEAFIDRVDDFAQLQKLYLKGLFPKLVIVGFIDQKNSDQEKINYYNLRKFDPYMRAIEVTHSQVKRFQLLPKVKNIEIDIADPKSWHRFVIEVITEYTKPYLVEESQDVT